MAIFLLGSLWIRNPRCKKGISNQTKDKELISDDPLLILLHHHNFQYFREGAEPVSGMARERFHIEGVYTENDVNVITSGRSCF